MYLFFYFVFLLINGAEVLKMLVKTKAHRASSNPRGRHWEPSRMFLPPSDQPFSDHSPLGTKNSVLTELVVNGILFNRDVPLFIFIYI